MVNVVDICEFCEEHEVQNFAIGDKGADIIVVTNRKNSSNYQHALELELTELGIDVGRVYFTPVIKCSDFETSLTNKQLKDHAARYLLPEIADIKPKFILGLGNEALLALTGKSGITKYRAKEYDLDGAKVMTTISPSAVRRNPGQLPGYKGDLRLFANKVKGLVNEGLQPPKYFVADTKEKFEKLLQVLDWTEELTFDVESTYFEYYEPRDKAYLISMAGVSVINNGFKKGVVSWAIPLKHPQSVWRNKWEQVCRIMGRHMRKIKRVNAHNASFDCKWAISTGMKLYPTFDTMLAIALLNENVQKGLKPQAISRLGVEPWGIDTGQLEKFDIADILHYNMLDSWYTYQIKLQLVKELKEEPRLAKIFKLETMPAQRDIIDAEMRGAWIDVARLKERKPIAEQKLADIEQRIREAAELPLKDSQDWPHTIKHLKSGDRRIPWEENFNASQFARWMLFEHCGLPVLERGKTKQDGSPGDPSMAEGVLMALKDRHPVVPPMLDRVTAQKHISSFFNPYMELYDENHRIHTTFKLAGTVTGRLSSGKSDSDKISGTKGRMRGVNLQQVPRDPFIRGLFGAPPGWTFVESDYSQIELRVAAYLADEQNMKHIYATGGDIHLATAARVTGLPESQVTKEIRKKVGKPVNFGFLYGMGATKFQTTAFENYGSRFTMEEAQAARRAYFELFPGLLPWHAKMRRLVNQFGRVVSPLGRIRHLPDVYSPDKGVKAEAERQAINSPVQGFGSDLAVISMIQINHKFKEQNIAGFCIGLVHDALNFEIRDDELPRALPIIKDTMEDMEHLYKQFGVVVDIPIIADVAVGQHWGEKVELTPEQVYDFHIEYKGG